MSYASEILNNKKICRPVMTWESENATKAQDKLIQEDYLKLEYNVRKWIKRAQHFTLPTNLYFKRDPYPAGRLWDGESLDKSVHLPYPLISLSSNTANQIKVFTFAQEDPTYSGEWPAWVLCPMEYRSDRWHLPPATIRVTQEKGGARGSASLVSKTVAQMVPEDVKNEVYTSLIDSMGYDIEMLFNLLTILHDQPTTAIAKTNTGTLYKSKSVNHGRRVTKKHEYKELVINNHYAPTRSGVSIPTGVTQRAHTRRGHERHYRNGKVIWIDSYTAGDASKGTINKDYRVEA
jgi:hypothetical protein